MRLLFQERHWDRLLTEIEEGKVVPLIGPELLEIENNSQTINFYSYLAQLLAERLEIEESILPERYNLNDVSMAFISQHGDRNDIYYEIRDIVLNSTWKTPQSLLQLAEIKHFNLYLTTTFDVLMKQALDEVRFESIDSTPLLSYNSHSKICDLPIDYHTERRPYVYQLFGRVSTTPDYVVTEDDLLQLNHRLQSKDFQPVNLFDVLKSKYLLSLGCNFPDWLARFFLCATKRDALFSEMGIRGVMADQYSMEDKSLRKFLERQKTLLYENGGAVEFVSELYNRWTERFGEFSKKQTEKELNVDKKFMKEEAIFISYASENLDEALRIKSSLEGVGLDVWFDKKQLKAGELYEKKIYRNIEMSSFFFPIISQNTTTLEPRYFRKEWTKAIDVSKLWPDEHPFIQPIVIDDTRYNSPYIPTEFKDNHWQWFKDGNVSSEFLDLTRQRIRQLRREKRNL